MPRAPKGIHMGSGWDQFFVDDSRQAEFEQTIDMIIGFQGTSQWQRHINWDLESYAYLNIMSETNVSYAVHQNDTDGEALWLPFDQQPDGTYARRSQDLRSQVYRDGFIERCKSIMRDGAAGVFFDDVNVDWGRMFRRTSEAPPASGADPLMSLASSYYEPATGDTYKNLIKSYTGSLSLYWTLGGTLEAEDQSGHGRHGVRAGSIELATINQDDGPLEYDDEGATDFNGIGNRIESTWGDTPFSNGVNRTFAGWAWRDTNDTQDDIFGGDGGTDRPRLSLSGGSQDVVWVPQTGQPAATWAAAWPGNAQWVFWVLLFSETGDTAELFINNVSKGVVALTTQYAAAPGNFKVGASGPSNSGVFDGRQAHIAVWNQLLTPTQIGELWTAARNEQPSHTGWPALLGDFLHYVINRVRTDPDGFPEAKFIFNPFWSQLTPLRWNDPRTGHMVDACDYCIIEHGHSDSGLVDAAPAVVEFSHFALRSQLAWVDFIHSRGKNYILYANSDDGPGWAEYEMAAFMSKYEPGDVVVIWGEDYLWPDYNPVFDTDYGQRTHYMDSNVTGGSLLAGFAEGRVEYTPGHPELGATFDDNPLPPPQPGAIAFAGASSSHLIYSRGEADATGALTFAALVRRRGLPSGTPKVFSLSSTGVFSSSGGKGGLALVNDDGDVVRLDAGGGGTWDTDVDVPFDEWCIIAATKPEGTDFGTMHCYPLTQNPPRVNLATNPKAGGVQTAGWTGFGAPTFGAVTLGAGGAPAASAELTALGITTAFHIVGDGDNDRAEISFPVVNGKHYRVALYAYLDSATSQGCRVNILNTANVVKLSAPSAIFSTLDTWTRIDTDDFIADETSATWKIRFRQSGAGAVDFYWTAVLIDEDDQVITELQPYYDGDRDGFEWSGTAQQSSSRAVQATPFEWQHDNGGGWASRGNIEGWDRLVVGGWHAISDWFKGDIALMGIWDEQLAKSQIESLSANLSSQDWWDAAKTKPSMLLEGRHAGEAGLTTLPFEDLSGTSAHIFGQGTTETPDGPPGWNYGAVLRPTAETLVGTLADDFHRGEFALEEKLRFQLASARRTNPDQPPELANDSDQTNFWESDVASIYNRIKNPKLALNEVAWSVSNSSGFTVTHAGSRVALPAAAGEGFGWRTAVTNPDGTARNAGVITPTTVDKKPELEPNQTYTMIAEGWVESIVGAPKLRLRQIVYDAAQVNVQDQNTDFVIPGTGWMRSARKFTTPANAANMRFAAQWTFPTGSSGASIDGYLTRFMLLKGDWTGVLPAYRDGDSVDGFWLGVANESDSVRPEWWQVELPTFEPIDRVDVHWADRRASLFEIWTSLDGEVWESQFKGVSEPGKQRIEVGLERIRFLRVVPYETVAGRDPVRIYEVRAFGAKGSPPKYLNFGPNDVVVRRDRMEIADSGAGTSSTVCILDKTLRDIEITGRFSFGPTGSRRQLVWKRHGIDVAKALTLRLLSDGEFRLMMIDAAGVETSLQLYSGNTILPAEGDHVWLRARQEGNTILSQLFTDDPFLGAQAVNEFQHSLATENRTDYGAYREGMFGVRLYDGDTTETGLESLVVSGLTPEQPTGITFTPIFIPPVLWKFILAESETMKHLADVSYGRNKHLDVINNKAGACNFVVPVDNEDWEEIEEGKHCIIAYRKNDPKWSGPIWNLKEDLPENHLGVSAVGWYETLVGRGLRRDLNIGTPSGLIIPGEIGLRLIDEINTKQREHYAFVDNLFIDQFNDPSWSSTRWTGTDALRVENGVMLISASGAEQQYTTSTYDARGKVIEARLLGITGDEGTVDVDMFRTGTSVSYYKFRVNYNDDGSFNLAAYDVIVDGSGGQTLVQIGSPAASSLRQPLHIRLRVDTIGANIVFEYSFDGIDWIMLGNDTSAWDMSDARISFAAVNGLPSGCDARIDYARVGPVPALQPSWITRGTQGDTSAPRWRSFKRGDGIQALFTQMVDLEDGFDFQIDPLTREMNTLPGSLDPGDPRIRDDVVFAYNWGPSNILKFGREGDMSVMRNRFNVQGKYNTALHEDLAAIEEFGGLVMEEWAQLSEVVDPNVLATYAVAEVVLRARPRKIVSFIPFPWTEDNSVPEPFEDYDVGDRVRVSARFGKRIAIDRLPVRIFGISVDVDDNGNERVSSLQVSP